MILKIHSIPKKTEPLTVMFASITPPPHQSTHQPLMDRKHVKTIYGICDLSSSANRTVI